MAFRLGLLRGTRSFVCFVWFAKVSTVSFSGEVGL